MLGVARYRHCRLSPSSSSALAARGGVVLVVQGVTIAVSALPTPCAAEATRGLGTVYELRIQEPPSRRHTGVFVPDWLLRDVVHLGYRVSHALANP